MVNTLELKVSGTGPPRISETSNPPKLAWFFVTRSDKCMKRTTKKRGRPPKGRAMTAAERMRAYRKRKRDAGMKSVRRLIAANNKNTSGVTGYCLEVHDLAVSKLIATQSGDRRRLIHQTHAAVNLYRLVGYPPQPLPSSLRISLAASELDIRLVLRHGRRTDQRHPQLQRVDTAHCV